MTREEAISRLKVLTDYEYDEDLEALDMAIKALEQQPCEDWHGVPSDEMTLEQARQAVKDLRKMLPEYLEQNPNDDCISREEALMSLTGDVTDCTIEEYIARLRDKLSKLPSVTPKEKTGWIPVSERLPEEDGQYLITVKYKHVNDSYEDVYAEHGEWYGGRWDTFCFGHCGEVEGIIAWMPLPESYRVESEDKE